MSVTPPSSPTFELDDESFTLTEDQLRMLETLVRERLSLSDSSATRVVSYRTASAYQTQASFHLAKRIRKKQFCRVMRLGSL